MPDPFTRSQAPSFLAPVTPPGREAEVTFISGVTADATVAATSFGAWVAFEPYPSNPAQYNPYYSKATKWGDPTLQLAGTPAVVTYQFDTASNWSDDEKGAWGATWRCGRRKSRSRSRSRQDRLPILPSLSKMSPGTFAVTYSLPGPRLSAVTSRALPSGASRSVATTTLIPNRSTLDSFAGSNDFYFALIHELGHAIGLGHGGPYNARRREISTPLSGSSALTTWRCGR